MKIPCITKSFKGVYSRNNLPNDSIQYPSIYIVNSDNVDGPGEHWVAIVLENKSHGIFFDSFGKEPCYYGDELQHFFDTNVKQFQHMTRQVQSKTSNRCGFFVLTFLMLHVCFHCTLDCIKQFFDSDVNVNDRIVNNFVNVYYDFCK